MGKSINAKELIEERYGKEGSKEREEFRENAFSYYCQQGLGIGGKDCDTQCEYCKED